MSEITKAEMIWNEANMFARDIISPAWIDIAWSDLPEKVQNQFIAIISEDIPRGSFNEPR